MAVVWIVGGYALVFGVLLIAPGLRLRGLQQRTAPSRRAGEPLGTAGLR